MWSVESAIELLLKFKRHELIYSVKMNKTGSNIYMQILVGDS